MKPMRLPSIANYNDQAVRFVQIKLNGYYCEVYRTESAAEVYFKGRGENLFSKLPAAMAEAIMRLPAGTILRAELHAPGIPATSVPTLLRTKDTRLTLTVFEVPSLMTRAFDEPQRIASDAGLPFVEFYRRTARPRRYCEDWLEDAAEELGVEGFVLKNYHGDDGFKYKPIRTVDAVVVGFKVSQSEAFAGGIRSLDAAIDGRVIASVSSGLSAELRFSNPNDLLGQVMEIEYQAVAAQGRLQHPRFVRFRDDKSAAMCRMDQL
jgi:hypothetical protein